MVEKEVRRGLDQKSTLVQSEDRIKDGENHVKAESHIVNVMPALANKIEGNQKIWDAEIKEIVRCLQEINAKIKEIVRVL